MRKIFYREAVKKARKLLNRKAAGRMIFHTRKIFRMRSRLWVQKTEGKISQQTIF